METTSPPRTERGTGPGIYICRDVDGTVVYVGQTEDWSRRQIQHRSRSAWWPEVVGIEFEPEPDADCRLAREAELIAMHEPKHNTMVKEIAVGRRIADSFPRSVCQPGDRPQYGALYEISQRWGISRQAVHNWRVRGLLPPAHELSMGAVWELQVIEAWEAARREAGLNIPGAEPRRRRT